MPRQFAYALRPLMYYGRQLLLNEVFELHWLYDDAPLIEAGFIALLHTGTRFYRHVPTGRHFIRPSQCEVFRLVYSGERITPTHPDFMLLNQDYLVNDTHPPMIPEDVQEALEQTTATAETPAAPELPRPQREPGQAHPELALLNRLLGPPVLDYYLHQGRWPTRQVAINLAKWPAKKPNPEDLNNMFRRAGTNYTAWCVTLLP